MHIKYYFYRSIDILLSPIPKKLIRTIIRWVKKGLEPYKQDVFNKEMNRRARLELNNFKALAKDIPALITPESYIPNDFYFNALTLKKFAGIDEDNYIKAAMEHGPYIADGYFWQNDIDAPFSSIIVNSPYRKEVLSKVCDKNIFVVGPYISYAENILSDEKIKIEKKRLGKNLLVFPMHSTHWVDVNYDVDNFINTIKKTGENFESIRICMYWKDILRGTYKQYIKAGFEVVCAGHIYEPNFLPRLKSLIEIADVTMSNQIGSQLGFSVCLNKPHYLIQDNYEYEGHLKSLEIDTEERNIKYQKGNNIKTISDSFSSFSHVITDEQRMVVDKYWGASEIKTKEELKKILLSLED